jgi:hypothetical protein
VFSLLFLRFLEKPLTPPKRVPGAESGEALTEDAGFEQGHEVLGVLSRWRSFASGKFV